MSLKTMSNTKLRLVVAAFFLTLVTLSALLKFNDLASALIFWGASLTLLAPDIRLAFGAMPKMAASAAKIEPTLNQATAVSTPVVKHVTNTQRRLNNRRANAKNKK